MQIDSYLVDNQLANFLQKKLKECPQNVKTVLHGVSLCGHRLIPVHGERSAVVVLSDGEKARYTGLAFCDNAWCCPRCQAKIMSEYGDRIKIALEEFKKLGYKAVMATFTFPHMRFLSCSDCTIMLSKLKTMFLKKTACTIPTQFLNEFGIKHYVWSAEFTFSEKNGWHPHFHTIFWVKADKFNEVADWEETLKKSWLKSAKNYLLKLKPTYKKTIDKLFEITSKTEAYQRGGVFFSKDTYGKIREITSSNYLVGWSASKELTGLEFKKAATGHYTPRQLLESAYNGNGLNWLRYLEFCMAVVGTKPRVRRVQFSHGFCKQVKIWRQQRKFEEVLYKKKEQSNFHPVVCFTKEQWRFICFECQAYTRANILYLARYPDLLFSYLDNLKIGYTLPADVPTSSIIADAYNNAA